jgi:hypothetical protein
MRGLLHKLIEIHSRTQNILDKFLTKHSHTFTKRAIWNWSVTQPIVLPSRNINFTPEEMADVLKISAKAYDIIGNEDARYGSIVAGLS